MSESEQIARGVVMLVVFTPFAAAWWVAWLSVCVLIWKSITKDRP